MAQGVVPISSANLKNLAAKAWAEVMPIAESLPKSKRGARFFPTDDCDTLIEAAIGEYYQSQSSQPKLDSTPLNFKTGGHVVFPGKTVTGQTTTIMIPLHITGEAKVGVISVDTDHYYSILSECDVEVLEGGKLVALVVSDIEWKPPLQRPDA